MLPRRFDGLIDFMRVKFISKNQHNNNKVFVSYTNTFQNV